MSKQTRGHNVLYSFLPTEVEGSDALVELALDMRWSWNHCADEVWRQLEPALWDLTHNPWVVLQTVSRDQLQRVLAEPGFRKRVEDLVGAKRQAADCGSLVEQCSSSQNKTPVLYGKGRCRTRFDSADAA